MATYPLHKYDWLMALVTICLCVSAFGNGANDVANSYATSVAARTLEMWQVGILSTITEFVGAVALGARVVKTIKGGIMPIDKFKGKPEVLLLAMSCAEFGSSIFLIIATKIGFSVSTTQTTVGALIGVAFASQVGVKWAWSSGSVSQIAASWGVAPAIAGAIGAIIFLTIKYSVLEQRDSLKWALRMIPIYLSFTGAMFALFIVVEAPTAPSLEAFGAGKSCGIVLGVLAGLLVFSYIFFIPYAKRRLLKNDARLRFYHVFLGPTLNKEDPWIYFPADPNSGVVIDHYASAHHKEPTRQTNGESALSTAANTPATQPDRKAVIEEELYLEEPAVTHDSGSDGEKAVNDDGTRIYHLKPTPEERWIHPYKHLFLLNPIRLKNFLIFFLFAGVSRDCVTHSSEALAGTHAKAVVYDNKVEHLWTYCQVASAMMMSIAHGSNDVSNAVGPWSGAYNAWKTGSTSASAPTPIFILAVAGLLLGIGFWFFGYHIIRVLGNKITQMSPTRGFSIEMGAAITVLMASRLGLPVSTTQCTIGSVIGVGLMNMKVGAVHWRQIAWLVLGWLLTLPCAGLLAGIPMLIALNTPHF